MGSARVVCCRGCGREMLLLLFVLCSRRLRRLQLVHTAVLRACPAGRARPTLPACLPSGPASP